jgi:hypothetical protein
VLPKTKPRDESDPTRPRLLLVALDVEALRHMLAQTMEGMESIDMMNDMPESALEMATKIFVLLNQLLVLTHDAPLRTVLPTLPGAPLLAALTATIEIARGDELERVCFAKPVDFQDLTFESKAHLLKVVDRSSPAVKLHDFCARSSELMDVMGNQGRIRKLLCNALPTPAVNPTSSSGGQKSSLDTARYFFLHRVRSYVLQQASADGSPHLENACFLLACLVNLLFGYTYISPEILPTLAHGAHSTGLTGNCSLVLRYLTQWAIFGMSWALFLATVTIYTTLAVFRFPMVLLGQDGPTDKLDLRGVVLTAFGHLKLVSPANRIFVTSFVMLYLAYLGLTVSPVYFSGHMLVALIKRSELVQNVIYAVLRNARSILLTGLLGMILIYIFTVLAYTIFPRDLAGPKNENCVTLFQCFVFILTSGTRAGGGVGELLVPSTWASPGHTVRIAYDFVFFLVVPVILLNIVFGIILDTFAQLRDERDRLQDDLHAQCFVCGIRAEVFDSSTPGGFSRHVKEEHNLWNYFFFLQHLQRKPPDEYTGQDSFVAAKLRQKDISFFPMGKALSLQQAPPSLLTPVNSPSAIPGTFSDAVLLKSHQQLADSVAEMQQQIQALTNALIPRCAEAAHMFSRTPSALIYRNSDEEAHLSAFNPPPELVPPLIFGIRTSQSSASFSEATQSFTEHPNRSVEAPDPESPLGSPETTTPWGSSL